MIRMADPNLMGKVSYEEFREMAKGQLLSPIGIGFPPTLHLLEGTRLTRQEPAGRELEGKPDPPPQEDAEREPAALPADDGRPAGQRRPPEHAGPVQGGPEVRQPEEKAAGQLLRRGRLQVREGVQVHPGEEAGLLQGSRLRVLPPDPRPREELQVGLTKVRGHFQGNDEPALEEGQLRGDLRQLAGHAGELELDRQGLDRLQHHCPRQELLFVHRADHRDLLLAGVQLAYQVEEKPYYFFAEGQEEAFQGGIFEVHQKKPNLFI